LGACKAQMQILEFNQTTSTSAKTRAESALETCERDLTEARKQQLDAQKRNEESLSALEKIRQDNIALDGKLQISMMQATDMDARFHSVKMELQQIKRVYAQERASLDKASRDALLKCSQREAEYARVVQQQQQYIEDLEGLTTGAKLVPTSAGMGLQSSAEAVGSASVGADARAHTASYAYIEERQELIAANTALRAELDASSRAIVR
jgi:hypothetical protein